LIPKIFAKIWVLQYFVFIKPIFDCSLQVLGSDPCRNVLFAIHLELFAISDGVTQGIANPLIHEGYNREQSKGGIENLQKCGNYKLIWLTFQSQTIRK
jgi:hypothetical protein